MANLLWALIYKVFIFIAAGAVLKKLSGSKGEGAAKVFVWAALYLLIPLYIFLTVWGTRLETASWKIAACALIVVLCGAGYARLWAAKTGISFRSHFLPVVFMNSAYLAIPVCTLIWGAQGAAYAIIYNVAVTVANFTLGVWWASKEKPIAEIAGLPVLYAVAAGALLNAFGAPFHGGLLKAGSIVSFVTLPVMLIFVGYRLGEINFKEAGLVLAGVCLRIGGGFVAGLVAVGLLGIKGPAAGVCVMVSSMPAAVYSYILTEKYQGNVPFAAASVFVGTLLSFFSIALIGYYFK